MKKIALIATCVFFIACLTAGAQTGQQPDMQMGMKKHGEMHGAEMRGGMMRGGMMDGMHHEMMMGCASMQKSMIMVNLLPEMDEQLSLSEDQTEQLIDLRSEFKKQQVDYQAELTKRNKKLRALINDNAPVDEIKNQMKAWADTRIDMHAAAYQAEREMKALLTDEQNQELEVIMEEHDGMLKKGIPDTRGRRG